MRINELETCVKGVVSLLLLGLYNLYEYGIICTPYQPGERCGKSEVEVRR